MDELKSPSKLEKNENEWIPFSIESLKIKSLLDRLYGLVSGEKFLEVYDKLALRAKYLQKKYPDYFNREVWHIMIGSSLGYKMMPVIEDDFPGDDSVEEFIKTLIEEYRK